MARGKWKVVPAEVRRVGEQLARWRAGKRGHERIPQRLWIAAAKLCGAHSIHRVSRWLHLNHTALQERARQRGRSSPTKAKPRFVEWKLPAGAVSQASSAEYVVELGEGGNRAERIHVRGADAAEVAALARALRGSGSGS